jgi:1,4-alpha-glucan branching enzyme
MTDQSPVDDRDLRLFEAGRHERLWEVLGAHPREDGGVDFAVWAPRAREVRLRGDHDRWSAAGAPLRSAGSSGVWYGFAPGAGPGTRYLFRILGADGIWRDKADPMTFVTETPPAHASVVAGDGYRWRDDAWLANRAQVDWTSRPMSVYEAHVGSWRPGLDYREFADRVADHAGRAGFTHVELLPVAEHPFGGSWGYQVSSYYAPTARFGSPDEFRALVDVLHAHGLGVILDWVPGHFPKDSWALARFDGLPLYEHPDPRRGEQPEWGTLVFDYGRPQVRNFLIANALFWLEEFHVDGLRVDAVSSMLYLDFAREQGEWLPNEHGGRENLDAVRFLRELTATVRRRHPWAVLAAEEIFDWPGVTDPDGLGFDLKWNVGWAADTLSYLQEDHHGRVRNHDRFSFPSTFAWRENFVLPLSHDEAGPDTGSLCGRMPGDEQHKLASLRALLAITWAYPGKPLLFMGTEFGQPSAWSSARALDWHLLADPAHQGTLRLVNDLNAIYRTCPALSTLDTSPAGFGWIEADDRAHSVFAFARTDRAGSQLVLVANFADREHERYRLGLPVEGPWTVLIDTAAPRYGGPGPGRPRPVDARPDPRQGQPASATITLGPNSVQWLVPEAAG